jgi:hypothetical protein
MPWVIGFTMWYFFIAGTLFGYGLGTGDAPRSFSPWQLKILFAITIIFWPLAIFGGWLLKDD